VSLEDRKLEVLRAIVEDYVSTNEPVGSKLLAERHSLGVSPATIRNDMAALEDEGYIAQPHTSAGRIPTDKGYRLFVDRLSSVKPLSGAERKAIQTFLAGAFDLDDVLRRTVRLLAQLTRQVAVVQYPSLSRSAVRFNCASAFRDPAHTAYHCYTIGIPIIALGSRPMASASPTARPAIAFLSLCSLPITPPPVALLWYTAAGILAMATARFSKTPSMCTIQAARIP